MHIHELLSVTKLETEQKSCSPPYRSSRIHILTGRWFWILWLFGVNDCENYLKLKMVNGWRCRRYNTLSEDTNKQEARSVMSNITSDLWSMEFETISQGSKPLLLLLDDSMENTCIYCMWAVTTFGRICKMHYRQYNLSLVDWCGFFLTLQLVGLITFICMCVFVCECMQQRERVESRGGSLGAGLALGRTNTLHYRPIYLINCATLSA